MPSSEAERGRAERERRRGERRLRAGRLTVIVARSAGYCYGVERALQITENALLSSRTPIATLGPIIHNPAVVNELAARGVSAVDDLDAIAAGTVVVRTHGVPPAVIQEARRRGLVVVDATCPFVTVAQRKAAALRDAGYVVVVLGERDHPEVAGLAACAGPASVVVEDPVQLDRAALRGLRIGVVVQTTQSYASLSRLASALAPLGRETLVYNTICEATQQRQEAACEVAGEVQLVLVVGGRNSANTRRLAALCREIQHRTYHVECAQEIQSEWLQGVDSVGITAGASTPDEEIEAVVEAVLRRAAKA